MPTDAFERFVAKCLKLSEQSSPFRRWTTGSGAGSSYRHHDHRNMYNKQMSEGSSPVAGATGGAGGSSVARWALGLEHLLADPAGFAAFAHFLDKEFASENIRFWWSCEQYRNAAQTARRALAAQIWQRHLAPDADEPVNVDAAAKRQATLLLAHQPPPADLFLQAQKQIFNVMKFDSYPRFLRSATHADCARAELRGLPPPYAPSAGKQDETKTNNVPLKKSASNASERRRSGGASLLPWRLRPASASREPHAPTDVVKSSQSAVGQPLCRVVLPDGATSVVSVEGAETVAQLVDRLLQRRNLAVSTYEVLLKDPAQGECASIDLQSSSCVLSGRSALVERRAVVHLELTSGGAARRVRVQCGGARRLDHVLRRVAARYRLRHAAAAPAPRAAPLPPDTLMQDLDGCRLHVVELGEEARGGGERGGDSDGDSLSELALRLQDDREPDTQSNSTSSSRSNSVHSHSGAGGGVGAARGAGAARGGGRVRAALRPGAPLHHHPPDFLDNLRETQRARGQKQLPPSPGDSPLPPATPPAPRTPPPLPPKPATRPAPAPALV